MNAVAYVTAVVLIAGGSIVALLVRNGQLRKWPQAYYESDTGDTVRNGVFGLLPFSGMLGCGLLAIALGSQGGAWADVALVFVLASFVLFWLGLRWMKRPPEWLQPQWRRAAERGEPLPGGRVLEARSRGRLEISPLQYWLCWSILGVVVVFGLVFGFTPAVPVAIGVGLTYLLSTRPRRA